MLTLVAEEASPAFLAVALPWLLAGPMKASWVTYALITVAAFKAHSAPDAQNKPNHPVRKSVLNVISTANDVNIVMNVLALSGFLAEAVLLITSREANCCKEDKTPALGSRSHIFLF